MTLRIVTAPSVEPVTLAEAKAHCRVDYTTDDALITAFIQVAREYAENYTRRAFVQRTLEYTLPCFPTTGFLSAQSIELPCPPLISVTHIKYIDANGVLQTVSSADYQVDSYREPGLVKPVYLGTWPIVTRTDFNAVQIRYEAGYTTVGSPTDYTSGVPMRVKQWMLSRISTMYENREAIVTGTIVSELKRDFIDGLLDGLMVNTF